MQAIEGDSRVVRTGDLLESEVDGEVVALDIENGQCYGLNGPGTRIWKLLETETTPAAIRDTLVDEFEVDPAQCEADVAALLGTLRDEGLITVR